MKEREHWEKEFNEILEDQKQCTSSYCLGAKRIANKKPVRGKPIS